MPELEIIGRPVLPTETVIDIILFCPNCGVQHVDAPEPETGWTNPPHRSHLCHHCNYIFRPSDSYTNGVAKIQTRGEKDSSDEPLLATGMQDLFLRIGEILNRSGEEK